MESSYGIGVQNRFELFYNDESHPLDFLKHKQSKKSLKNDETAEKENQGKTKTKDTISGKKPLKNDVGTKSFGENDSRYGNHEVGGRQLKSSTSHSNHDEHKLRNNERVKFSDREERNNRRNEPAERRENRDTHEGGVPQRFDGDARGRGGRGFSSGPYRGRGARRGGRGGPGGFSGGDFRGKREFDRQSGMVTSGVKAFDKRDGAGPYNWGSDKDQIEEQMQGDISTDGETGGNSEKAQGEDGSSPATDDAQREEEAAQREMTLDEWKALQKREKPIFKTRLPGEGENTAQWKKTYVLKKKEEDKNATSDEEDNAEEEEEAHHGRKKVLLPIDFQFADTPTRGRGRGRGRGGPGGRGRGMGGFNSGGGGGGGGRGGFSGGGGRGTGGVGSGRGGGRGGPPHARSQAATRQEAPKMDDERDFPSLG